MNSGNTHDRAERLIAQERVEGISAADQRWLSQHLRGCEACAATALATDRALRSLKSVVIAAPRGLAERTQFRLRIRAQQEQQQEPGWRLLWAACAASWTFGAVSAPYVWRGLHWLGQRMALPPVIPEIGFGLWWALPAIVAAVVVLVEKTKYERRREWLGEQD
jgi:hypothetical protein